MTITHSPFFTSPLPAANDTVIGYCDASGSLYWTVGVATSYDEISSSDYVPLGSDAFLCRGRVVCTTKTKYQTVNFDLNYDMLWVRQGNYWMIRDLAFAKYESTK